MEENTYYSELNGCTKITDLSCETCYIAYRDQCTAFESISSCLAGCLIQQTETSTTCMKCKQYEMIDLNGDGTNERVETPQFLDATGICRKCKEGCGSCVDAVGCRECLPNYVMVKDEKGISNCQKPNSSE